jgi:hypothetical protein
MSYQTQAVNPGADQLLLKPLLQLAEAVTRRLDRAAA